jgi:hypothetical protein
MTANVSVITTDQIRAMLIGTEEFLANHAEPTLETDFYKRLAYIIRVSQSIVWYVFYLKDDGGTYRKLEIKYADTRCNKLGYHESAVKHDNAAGAQFEVVLGETTDPRSHASMCYDVMRTCALMIAKDVVRFAAPTDLGIFTCPACPTAPFVRMLNHPHNGKNIPGHKLDPLTPQQFTNKVSISPIQMATLAEKIHRTFDEVAIVQHRASVMAERGLVKHKPTSNVKIFAPYADYRPSKPSNKPAGKSSAPVVEDDVGKRVAGTAMVQVPREFADVVLAKHPQAVELEGIATFTNCAYVRPWHVFDVNNPKPFKASFVMALEITLSPVGQVMRHLVTHVKFNEWIVNNSIAMYGDEPCGNPCAIDTTQPDHQLEIDNDYGYSTGNQFMSA